LVAIGNSNGGVEDAVKEFIPLRKVGTKHDVAMSAIFLASDETSGNITGIRLDSHPN
jgi:NAD(P)-dependent dehydrogenase (short-subunit alcohol dehydrogenase family)